MSLPNSTLLKLTGVVREVVGELDKTADLNVKIAEKVREHNLNHNELDRVIEWSNTLKQLKNFKSGAKKAEFDLADRKKVLAVVHGADKKMAQSDPGVDKYVQPQVSYLNTELKKKSSFSLSDYDKDPADLVKSAMAKISHAKRYAQQGAIEFNISMDKANEAMTQIVKNFDRDYCTEKFADFEIAARKEFGDKAIDYLDILEKQASKPQTRFTGNLDSINFYDNSTENIHLLKSAMVHVECALTNLYLQKKAEVVEKSWSEELRTTLNRSM